VVGWESSRVARWLPDGEKDRIDAPFCTGEIEDVVDDVVLVGTVDVEETVGAVVGATRVV